MAREYTSEYDANRQMAAAIEAPRKQVKVEKTCDACLWATVAGGCVKAFALGYLAGAVLRVFFL